MVLRIPRQNHQEVANRRNPWLLLWVFASFALMEVYSLFPYDHKEVRMFPLDPTLISFQTWVDYVAWRTKAIVDLFIIRALFPFYRKEMNVFIWLSVGYL